MSHCSEALRERTLRHLGPWRAGAVGYRHIRLLVEAVNMSLRDLSPQVLWVQVLFQSVRLASPTAVSVLNVLIEEVIFGDVLGINRTLDDKFAPHCSPVDDFNQIYEVLFGFEASYEFSVIRRPAAKREVTVVRAFQCEACRVSSKWRPLSPSLSGRRSACVLTTAFSPGTRMQHPYPGL